MTPNWFVAWPVTGLEETLSQLRISAPGGLDFLDPSDIHVTLAFLGRFDPKLVSKMTSLLKGLPFKTLEVSTGPLIALPQPRRFSAISFSVKSGARDVNEQFDRWHARICREAGAAVDTRRKLPHITIARPDRRIGADDRQAALEWIEARNTDDKPVSCRLERPRIYSWSERQASNRYCFVDEPSSL